MHLLDLAGYEANPALQRPGFWDAGLYKVKSDAPNKVLGLNVREHHKPDIRDEDYEANNAKYENKLTTLPRGTRIETGEAAASPNHNWRRLIRATPAVEGLAENTGWVYVPEAKELAENHYLVSEDKSKDIPALEQIGLHVRESANATSNVLAVLPRGTEITVSGEGKYVKLETIVSGNAIPPLTAGTDGKLPGYVWLESLEAQRSPNDLAKDKVYTLAEAQSIKAGELIGHMGLYQEHDQEGPTSRLHLEVFSCEDVPAFIEKSKERWPGFSDIQDTTTLVSQQAQSLNAQGELSTEEAKTYAAKIDEAEHGEIFKELFKIIDQPNSEGVCDKKLTPLEIKSALGKPWLAQQLSLLITHYESEWFWKEEKWDELDKLMDHTPADQNLNWVREKERIQKLSWWREIAGQHGINTSGIVWQLHPIGLISSFKINNRCYCYEQGIVNTPCQQGIQDVTKDHFENLAQQLNVEREVLRAIAVAETGDKSPFKEFVPGQRHARILYERHYMRRLLLKSGLSREEVDQISVNEPKIVHTYERNYSYGPEQQQYVRLQRARQLDFDAANMSCSWGKFQVMGEYYGHLYSSTKELVEAQNYCALQHLQYFKIFLTEEKKMLSSMQSKNWKSIAEKYNGLNQVGYDEKIEEAYKELKEAW